MIAECQLRRNQDISLLRAETKHEPQKESVFRRLVKSMFVDNSDGIVMGGAEQIEEDLIRALSGL